MEYAKNIILWLARLVVTIIIIVFTYIFVGNVLGTIIFFIGAILLLIISIFSLIGMVRGRSKLLKSMGRFNFFMIFSNCLAVSIVLLVTWSANIILEEEFGELSASEKISLIHSAVSSNENEISAFTQGYPELESGHITFRYHPDTIKSVEEMIATLDVIKQMEKDIYGREIEKTESLEVLVLRNADDYFKLNNNFQSADRGLYDSNRKRAMIYQGGVSGMEDDLYVIETFVHEYSHYLFDLFLEQEELNMREVPIWFNEGIAEFMTKRVITNTMMPGEGEFTISYLDLHTDGEWDQALLTNNIYYQSYLGVEYIVGNQGNVSVLADILLNQKESGDFTQAFEKTTGLDLAGLHQSISLVDQKLDVAWDTWALDRDFEKADSLYKEILKKLPTHSLAWHQYALMFEEDRNWEEALAVRREDIRINPGAAGFLNTSYLLILTDSGESMEMANKALEAAEQEPYGSIQFIEQWVEDVSHYHQLITDEKYGEAYDAIIQSEPLSYQQSIVEELITMKTALEN